MVDLNFMRRQAKGEEDLFQRQRFNQHNRSMAMQGMGSRNAEMTLAQEQLGRDFTRGEQGVWHNYVTKGGKKPSSGLGGDFGAAPTMGAAPTLNLPEYDEDKVSELTQKRAAPGVRRLRETTQQAMGETYENPNVKRMTVREALSGYGSGLENVMAGAGSAATQEYGQQYAASVSAEMARFQGALSRRAQEYQTQSQSYLMGQQQEYWKEQQDYSSDPYAAFNDFYS